MNANSTPPAPTDQAPPARVPKPYPNFPLSPHALGYWAKRINGNLHYFGRWGRVVNGVVNPVSPDGDWQTALKLYEADRERLYAGREPRARLVNGHVEKGDEELTVALLCNEF